MTDLEVMDNWLSSTLLRWERERAKLDKFDLTNDRQMSIWDVQIATMELVRDYVRAMKLAKVRNEAKVEMEGIAGKGKGEENG